MCYSQNSNSHISPDHRHPSAHYQIQARCSSERVNNTAPEHHHRLHTKTMPGYRTLYMRVRRRSVIPIYYYTPCSERITSTIPGIENVKMKKHCFHKDMGLVTPFREPPFERTRQEQERNQNERHMSMSMCRDPGCCGGKGQGRGSG